MIEKRYIGIDYGGRRIGLAQSDVMAFLATPVETLIVAGMDDALAQVSDKLGQFDLLGVVLGWPLNMSGSSSKLTEEVELFATRLTDLIEVPIYLEDERLSSTQARSILHTQGKKTKGNKPKIDQMAAALILQSFLDRLATGWSPKPFQLDTNDE